MANLVELQHHLSEAVGEITSLPVEHWECWIVQFLKDLDKEATGKGHQDEFREMMRRVRIDMDTYIG